MSVRWAFIGAGRHVRLWMAPALAGAVGAHAIGVWSRNEEHARAFSAEYSIPRAYPMLDDLLSDREVDAVYISTPNSLHAPHALAALRAGKHVLCEKPMATSIEDASEMVRLASTAGRHLGVGFQLRHNRVAKEARRLVMAGAIGKVLYAMAQFNLTSSPPPRLSIPHAPWKRDPVQMGGAGALMGLGVHIIDLLRFLVGQEVCMVQASASGVTADQPLETFGQVLLEFDGEAHGHITYGGSFPLSRNDAVLYGSGGRLIADGVVDVASRGALHLTAPDTATGTRTESWNPEPADHYRCEFEAFSRAIVTGAPFTASGVDGLRAVEATDAIIQSQQLGRRIPVTRVTA